jgi:hypothetical protein
MDRLSLRVQRMFSNGRVNQPAPSPCMWMLERQRRGLLLVSIR